MEQRPDSDIKTIMIVDDDQALSEMLSIVLEDAGFNTLTCFDGLRAVEMFPTIKPDLILLDVMLPGIDGVEVAARIRHVADTPIIMLTAKSDTTDVVAGLEAGADDYVAKPFKVTELIARVHARLRTVRSDLHDLQTTDSQRIDYGTLSMDREGHTVLKYDRALHLTPMEFELLFTLAANPGRVISRQELLNKVWGYEGSGDTRLVNVHIQRLRAKVEKDSENPRIVQTVRGIGYKFVPPETSSPYKPQIDTAIKESRDET